MGEVSARWGGFGAGLVVTPGGLPPGTFWGKVRRRWGIGVDLWRYGVSPPLLYLVGWLWLRGGAVSRDRDRRYNAC